MSEYQRFISYMYEYRNGKKSTNCGYARVENRNRLCRLEIHMKTSPQALEEPLRIYGCFHRDGLLFGILLGQHAPVLDMVNWRYQGDPDNLNASQVSLSQLEGLILSDGSQIAYCSMWNDTVIDPNQMTPYIKEEPESAGAPSTMAEPEPAGAPSTMAKSEALPEGSISRNNTPADGTDAADILPTDRADVSASSPMDTADASAVSPMNTADTSVVSSMNTADTPDSLPADTAGAPDFLQADAADALDAPAMAAANAQDIPQAASRDNAVSAAASFSADAPNPAAAELSDRAVPDTRPSTPAPDSKPAREIPPENHSQADIFSSSASENALPDEPNGPRVPIDEPFPDDYTGDDSAGDISARERAAAGIAANAFPADTSVSGALRSAPSRRPESNMADAALAFQQKQAEPLSDQSTASSPWEQIQASYPQINPFTDDEIQNCVRVELSDLPALRQNGWRIAGNRFILHSFQKNRHLVLGRLKSNGRYIFAVPGYYDNQERFMANMFGFPYFKSTDGGPLRYGQKGYWYRLLY